MHEFYNEVLGDEEVDRHLARKKRKLRLLVDCTTVFVPNAPKPRLFKAGDLVKTSTRGFGRVLENQSEGSGVLVVAVYSPLSDSATKVLFGVNELEFICERMPAASHLSLDTWRLLGFAGY